eukprot:Skav233687  [mRNA]  locus=scaffold1927:196656:197990:- [translate_table: standard]
MAQCPPSRGALASSDVGNENVQQAAEEIVRAGEFRSEQIERYYECISVEVLLKAVGIILEPAANRKSGKAQIAALRHVVSSAELLCREDKTILMFPAQKLCVWCFRTANCICNKVVRNMA